MSLYDYDWLDGSDFTSPIVRADPACLYFYVQPQINPDPWDSFDGSDFINPIDSADPACFQPELDQQEQWDDPEPEQILIGDEVHEEYEPKPEQIVIWDRLDGSDFIKPIVSVDTESVSANTECFDLSVQPDTNPEPQEQRHEPKPEQIGIELGHDKETDLIEEAMPKWILKQVLGSDFDVSFKSLDP